MRSEFTKVTQPTYDLYAIVSPDGSVERVNIYARKSFSYIAGAFNIKDTRLLVVSKTGQPGIYLIDLWNTTVTDTFPYQEPWFVPDVTLVEADLVFDHIDQAIAWASFNANDLPRRL